MFLISSIVKGIDTQIIVKEPNTWTSNSFQISFENSKMKSSIILKIENGSWFSSNENNEERFLNSNLEQLEINSIGYKIAQHWSKELEQQLEKFQLSV